jgi:hypothetical protein
MRRRTWLALVGLVMAVSVLPAVAEAGSDDLVGWNFRISGKHATSSEAWAATEFNPAGNEYLVVWTDWRNSGYRGSDIYGQRVTSDGRRVGPNFRISGKNATGDDYEPEIVYNSIANEYLVVWDDRRHPAWEGTRGFDIYGQRITADGNKIGFNFRISGKNATANESGPVVTHNTTANEYLVIWTDWRQENTRGADIYGRRINADGQRLGHDFRISGKNAIGSDGLSDVTYNSADDEYLVVWMDDRHGPDHPDIYGQRLSPNAIRLGTNFRISDEHPSHVPYDDIEYRPVVAYNALDNQYLVAWSDSRNYPGVDIYGQRLSRRGEHIGPSIRVSWDMGVTGNTGAAVTHDSVSNEYLIVWDDSRGVFLGRGTDIYGQRLTALGKRQGPNFRISRGKATPIEGTQESPDLIYNSTDNRYLVVWTDRRHGTDPQGREDDIYGQLVNG